MRNTISMCRGRFWALGLVAVIAPLIHPQQSSAEEPAGLSREAIDLHQNALVFDAHNNLIVSLLRRKDVTPDSVDLSRFQQGLHTDLPRLKQGGVGAEFFASYVTSESIKKGTAVRETLEQIESTKRLLDRFPQAWALARGSKDVERFRSEQRLAALIAIENGAAIDNSLAVLRSYYEAGVRCLALTHDDTHSWADAALDKPKHGGLSPFGEKVVAELNQLGVVIDLSHASEETIQDTLAISRAPVLFSHSGARHIAPHLRNLSDETLAMLAKNRGVVQVNFFPGYMTAATVAAYEKRSKAAYELRKSFKNDDNFQLALKQWLIENPLPKTAVTDVVDHIDHVVKVAGIDHVGLGSNFDGMVSVPHDLNDVSCFPRVTQELLNRGYSHTDVQKILGQNTLRVLREVEQCSESLRQIAQQSIVRELTAKNQ